MFFHARNTPKPVFSLSYAQDPAGEAYDAPQTPIVGWRHPWLHRNFAWVTDGPTSTGAAVAASAVWVSRIVHKKHADGTDASFYRTYDIFLVTKHKRHYLYT